VNPSVEVAIIGAVAIIIVALISYRGIRHQIKSNELIAGVSHKLEGVGENVEKVVHSVDGTQKAILAELQRLTAESAGRGGQLQERDRTEARADMQAEKKENSQMVTLEQTPAPKEPSTKE
jgi:hypothetical protein